MLCLLAAIAIGFTHPAPVRYTWWSNDGSKLYTSGGTEVKEWTPDGQLIGGSEEKEPVGYSFSGGGDTNPYELAVKGEPNWVLKPWRLMPKGIHHLIALRYNRDDKRVYLLWQSSDWKGHDLVKMSVNSIGRDETKPRNEAQWWQACHMPDYSDATMCMDGDGHPCLILPDGNKTILRRVAAKPGPDVSIDEDCKDAYWVTDYDNDMLLCRRMLAANRYLWRAYRMSDGALIGEKSTGWIKVQPFSYMALSPDGKHVAGRLLPGEPAGSDAYRAWIAEAGRGKDGLDQPRKPLEDPKIKNAVELVITQNQRSETIEDTSRPREYAVFKQLDEANTFVEEQNVSFSEGANQIKLPSHPLEAGYVYTCLVVFDSIADETYSITPSLFRTSDGLETGGLSGGGGKVTRLQDRKTLVGTAIGPFSSSQLANGGLTAAFVVHHTGFACKARARLYRSKSTAL